MFGVQQQNFSFILCVSGFELRPLSLVCRKWDVFWKQELILSHIVLVILKEWTVFRNQLNFTQMCQMSERKSNITQCKLKTSFELKSDLFSDCGICVFFCHCGWNFEKAIEKPNGRKNNAVFQYSLICLSRTSLRGARSSAFTPHNQFPYTQERNVLVWLT